MLLSDLPEFLDDELSYPIDLDGVLAEIGEVEIEAPNTNDSETINDIIGHLGDDAFDNPEQLFDTILGNVSDTYIGRKFYDDRSDNPIERRLHDDDSDDVSF